MRITRSHGDDIDDPTDRQIEEVLEDLEDDNGSFAILSDGDDFIQATGQLPDQLMVEYQEGGVHHRSRSQSLTLDEVKEMFRQYRRGSTDWNREYEWKEAEIGGGSGCAGMLLSLMLVVAAVAAVAA